MQIILKKGHKIYPCKKKETTTEKKKVKKAVVQYLRKQLCCNYAEKKTFVLLKVYSDFDTRTIEGRTHVM